jgi:hypothetical protein
MDDLAEQIIIRWRGTDTPNVYSFDNWITPKKN